MPDTRSSTARRPRWRIVATILIAILLAPVLLALVLAGSQDRR